MKQSINPVTKLPQTDFQAKVVYINPEERTMNNEKKTKYHGCVIEFANASGELKRTGAVIYANNLKYGIKLSTAADGEAWYAARATVIPGSEIKRPFISVSHLENKPLSEITEDDFGFEEVSAEDLKLAKVGK